MFSSLSTKQQQVIRAIGAGAGSPQAIARQTGIPHRSVVGVVVSLRPSGLIEGRNDHLRLTARGRALLAAESSSLPTISVHASPSLQAAPATSPPPSSPERKHLRPMSFSEQIETNPVTSGCLAIAIVAVLIFSVWGCASIEEVPPGHIGVKKSWGKLDPKPLPNDWYFVWPWQDLVSVSVQGQVMPPYARNAEQADCAVTLDDQRLGFAIGTSYSLDPKLVPLMVEEYGPQWEKWSAIIESVRPQAAKSILSQASLTDTIRGRETRRQEIGERIQALVNETLKKKNVLLEGAVVILQVTLDNLDYSNRYQEIIERTMETQREIEEQRQRLARLFVEQQGQVVSAEAAQQATVIKARGDALADLIRLEVEMERIANLVLLGADPNTIITLDRLKPFLEKWQGGVPQFITGDSMGELTTILRPQTTADGSASIDRDAILLLLQQTKSRRADAEQAFQRALEDTRREREKAVQAMENAQGETPLATDGVPVPQSSE